MERRVFIVQSIDKENAEHLRDKYLETLQAEGFFIVEDSLMEINHKWQVRILAEDSQGGFDFG